MRLNIVRAARLLVCFLVIAGCGGGDSSSTPPPSNPPPSGNGFTWTRGVFQPAANFAAQCRVPRAGTDPATGRAYPDRAGSTTAENYWLRSWSNDLYLWFSELPDLDPANTNDTEAYFNLLKTSAVTPSGAPKDKFHFIYNSADWHALSTSGQSVGYGIEWEVVRSTPPRSIVVRLVEAGSAAAAAGVVRGMQVTLTDGVDVINDNTQAGVERILEALYPETAGGAHAFRFMGTATIDTTLTAGVVTSNPVPVTSTIDTASGKVGYLLFTSHIATAESRLVTAINTLKAAGIQDLVLDLRYNGGGYLDLASELAYMIAGPAQTAGKTFELVQFNSKHPVINPVTGTAITPVGFHNTTQGFQGASGQALPNLGLARVYVLTSDETCSASESIINGLKGAGVTVHQIGLTTCGKPYGFYPQDNCGTTYFSIQFRGVNHAGFGDYADGFSATRTAATGDARANLPGCGARDDLARQLGDPAEELLRVALTYRQNGTCTPILPLSIDAEGRKQAAEATSGEGGVPVLPPFEPWRDIRVIR
jgi:carboxyl-terminal processing protease